MANITNLGIVSCPSKRHGYHGYNEADFINKETGTYKIKKYQMNTDVFNEFIGKVETVNSEMVYKIMIKSNTQIFDGGNYKIIIYNNKYNCAYNDGKLISKDRFCNMTYFSNNIAGIQRDDGKRNYITLEGKILSTLRFDKVYKFKDGRGIAMVDSKRVSIDTTGLVEKI